MTEVRTATVAEGDALHLQQASDQVTERLRGGPVGQVAAALASHPSFRALHDVPAFIEWMAREISGGRSPVITLDTRSARSVDASGTDRARWPRLSSLPEPGVDIPSTAWDDLLDHVLIHQDVEVFWQPIIDLHGPTVVGYEGFARFAGATGLSPDRWFSEAATRGRRSELEALALRAASPPSRRRSTELLPVGQREPTRPSRRPRAARALRRAGPHRCRDRAHDAHTT